METPHTNGGYVPMVRSELKDGQIRRVDAHYDYVFHKKTLSVTRGSSV